MGQFSEGANRSNGEEAEIIETLKTINRDCGGLQILLLRVTKGDARTHGSERLSINDHAAQS
jgi:hypothetical protein